jgi:hypothetical protein
LFSAHDTILGVGKKQWRARFSATLLYDERGRAPGSKHPTALAYALFFHGVKSATASEASIGALAEPLTGTVLAVVIFGERLGPWGLVGAVLLISVIAFLYRNGTSGAG